MTFSYYLFWTSLPNFLRKFWLAHKLTQRATQIFKKKFFFSVFFNFFFYLLFLQNISSIHYVDVENIIFFIWNYIFLFVFENKYIRIGIFVVFLSERMKHTSNRIFYYFVKQFASVYLLVLSIINSVNHCHS